MTTRADVVIIGAGIIGAAIGLELSRKGYKTLNVDKLPAAGYGPTSNSCSIVRAHYSTWDGVAMAFENFHYWEDWGDYVEAREAEELAAYVRCGTVLLKGSNGHHDKVVRHFDAIGVPYEDWDYDTLMKHAPFLNGDSFWPPARPEDEHFWNEPTERLQGAIFTPGSGYVNDPQLATRNLQHATEGRGGQFLYREEVREIRRDSSRVLGITLASGEKIDAPVVINVAGPWSFVINRMAGVEEEMNVKTRALRHEVHHVPAPEELDFGTNGFHFSDQDQALYFRPEVGNTILLGSEDPACDPQIWVDDPDDYDRAVTQAQWEAQVYRLARRLPGLRIPNERRGVVDLYDVSDDWMPIYDKSVLAGFYMAVGTSGNQFKNAGGVGHLMAELVDACENGSDHDTHPVQVKARYTGLVLDAGFYSRHRSLNEASSFSVNG